jgi:hypothetical protein
MIGLTGPAWAAEHLRILYQPDESQVQVKHLDFGDVTGFATRLKSELAEAAKTAPVKSSELLDYWLAARRAVPTILLAGLRAMATRPIFA